MNNMKYLSPHNHLIYFYIKTLPDSRWSPLIYAAKLSNNDDHIEIIRLLLDNGANVNHLSEDNMLPFQYAYNDSTSKQSNIATLKLLLERKYNANIKLLTDRVSAINIIDILVY